MRGLTSSAAIVTVWFVAMAGMMFACIQMKWGRKVGKGGSQTWLLVMDEKRKIADGRERKKA